jgi:hypothetical protein
MSIYIDERTIKIGDLAFELGDYLFAKSQYKKALASIQNDDNHESGVASYTKSISEKMEQINELETTSKSIFKYEFWKLSKSTYMYGCQCTKYLYLSKFKSSQKTPFDPATIDTMNDGRDFEMVVRNSAFPNGFNLDETNLHPGYFNSLTKHLLDTNEPKILYEATFIENEVLAKCDIVVKDDSGHINVYEIKGHSSITDAIIDDTSIQYFICKSRFGKRLSSFQVIHKDPECESGYQIVNLTELLDSRIEETKRKIVEFKTVLSNNEPEIKMGTQCLAPYKCQFMEYCELLK